MPSNTATEPQTPRSLRGASFHPAPPQLVRDASQHSSTHLHRSCQGTRFPVYSRKRRTAGTSATETDAPYGSPFKTTNEVLQETPCKPLRARQRLAHGLHIVQAARSAPPPMHALRSVQWPRAAEQALESGKTAPSARKSTQAGSSPAQADRGLVVRSTFLIHPFIHVEPPSRPSDRHAELV